MFTIENELLQVTIGAKGGELQNIFHKNHQLQYLWNGDPSFWAKRSPVLFPIVGTLKKDTYFYKDKPYQLGRHGFARDMEFEMEALGQTSITLLLRSNAVTLLNFPFEFEFRIRYAIEKNNLTVTYNVKNSGEDEMYFSVGGHPAFKVPLIRETDYSDYYLEFNEDETLARWPISKEGLIEKHPAMFLQSRSVLPLTKELFYNDALVFKQPTSSMVSLLSDKTEHGFDFDFSGFPYLGIWAARNADFVCTEPWCGIADSVDSDQQLTDKEGINKLSMNQIFEKCWKVSFF